MNDTEDRVKHGQEGAKDVANAMIKRLHWAIKCGGEGGDLDDILYTVKALGMVVSTDVDFDSGPAVTNGFSFRWHSVFGGGMGDYSQNGLDSGGYSGVHARSAIGGFTGKFSIEPEIIVAIPKELSTEIISNRGWIFPLIPEVFEIKDPPTIVINMKYKLKLLSEFINDNPELLKLLKTLIIIFNPL